jgi:Zn-dependent protease with chaperone function
MRLASVALVAGPTLLVLLSPWVAARLFDGRAPARTVATFHLLALAGMAALPLVALPCLAVIRPADLDTLASLNVIRVAQTAARALAIAYVLRVVWVAVGTSRATSRLATTALAATERLPTSGGPLVHVVASRRPIAYSFGGSAGGVVVSRGLLALLDDEERDAVLAHELAHLRLRHHRLLRFAQVVSTALGAAVPAAADAAAFLARELEVIADQAAASQVGDRRIVARALARATLATARATPAPIPALAFGGEPDLAYRLDRLLEEPRRDDRRRVATGAIALLAAGLVAIMAGAVQPTDPVGGVVVAGVTLLSIAWLSWRAVAPPTRSPSQAKRLETRGCRTVRR